MHVLPQGSLIDYGQRKVPGKRFSIHSCTFYDSIYRSVLATSSETDRLSRHRAQTLGTVLHKRPALKDTDAKKSEGKGRRRLRPKTSLFPGHLIAKLVA